MKTAVILARVSTMAQDFDRQVNELKYYALNNDLNIVKIFANKISGAKSNDERCEIIELIQYVKENHVDKVLVLEISRLGRNTLEALKVIELLNHEKICLCVKNYNIETLDSLGNINPMAQFLITILLKLLEWNVLQFDNEWKADMCITYKMVGLLDVKLVIVKLYRR